MIITKNYLYNLMAKVQYDRGVSLKLPDWIS